jgi:hypothetical protein
MANPRSRDPGGAGDGHTRRSKEHARRPPTGERRRLFADTTRPPASAVPDAPRIPRTARQASTISRSSLGGACSDSQVRRCAPTRLVTGGRAFRTREKNQIHAILIRNLRQAGVGLSFLTAARAPPHNHGEEGVRPRGVRPTSENGQPFSALARARRDRERLVWTGGSCERRSHQVVQGSETGRWDADAGSARPDHAEPDERRLCRANRLG